MSQSKEPTLLTLAERLNVTPTTISKALRGKPDISAAMIERVRTLADELNYTPNFAARSLKQRAVDTIGVLLTQNLATPWYGELVSRIEDEISARGKTMLLATSKGDLDRERKSFESFFGGRVEGIIVGPVLRSQDLRNIWRARERGVPLLTFNCVDELPVNYVAIDQARGAELAVQYLLDHGHTDIVYLCCPENDLHEAGKTRREGFVNTLHANGLPLYPHSIVPGVPDKRQGWKAVNERLAARRPLPTAFFCHNDSVALGAMLALQQAGVGIPDQVSIVGFDDIEEASMSLPPLTTIGGVGDRMAASLVETLEKIIACSPSEPVKETIVPRLIERESVRRLGA